MPHLFSSYVKASPRSGLIIYFALVLGLEKLPTEEVKETEAAILKRSDGQFCLFT